MDAKVRVILLLVITSFVFTGLVLADPSGPDSINVWSNETSAGSTTGSMVNISGGYISTINISATVQNDNWKAFIGYVLGSFTLDDSAGSTIYDWSLSTIGGEIFATRDSGSIEWSNIGCATPGEITSEETLMHHTSEDNISSTFSKTNDNSYIIAGQPIGIGACSSTNSYVNNATQDTTFEEFILHDDTSIIYGTKIDQDSTGYSGGENYDFQMLVPENGSQLWTGATPYYLYVELS